MDRERDLVDYVCGSFVRTVVLEAIAERSRSTDEILDTVEASESAVYDALAGLEGHGIVRQASRTRWEPTGIGTAVLSVIAVRDRTETVIENDERYWRDHDVAALPEPFRSRIYELAGADVVRSTDTDPHRVVRKVGDGIESAEELLVIAPVYHERYESALAEVAPRVEPRIVVDATTVRDRMAGEFTDEPPEFEGVEARVTDIEIALAVTHDALFLSLPTLDGEYDARAEVIAHTDDALRWGRGLFEHCWERATPAETYLKGQSDLVFE